MNVVPVSDLPPLGPLSDPITCSKRQPMEPVFGQLACEPARIEFTACAHTLLLSYELCHVALPNGRGSGACLFGFVLGLRKCVIICRSCPKKLVNSVAS